MNLEEEKIQSHRRGLYRLAHHGYDQTEPGIIAEWANVTDLNSTDIDFNHADYLVKFFNFDGTITYSLVVTAHNADLATAIAIEYLVMERKEDFQLPFSIEEIAFEARLIQTSFNLNTFDAKGYANQVESDSFFWDEEDQDASKE